MGPCENPLARREDSHRIIQGLPLNKFGPLLAKMPPPLILSSIVWDIDLEIQAVGHAALDDLLVLAHQIVNMRALWMWTVETKQCN